MSQGTSGSGGNFLGFIILCVGLYALALGISTGAGGFKQRPAEGYPIETRDVTPLDTAFRFFWDLYYAQGTLAIVVSLGLLAIGIFFTWIAMKAYDESGFFMGQVLTIPATWFMVLGGTRCLFHFMALLHFLGSSGN